MKTQHIILASAAALLSAGAGYAQTAPTATAAPAAAKPTTGATVYDPQGGVVGTVSQINGDIVTVSTGTAQASFPTASFAAGPNGPAIALTKAEVEAQVAQAQAQQAEATKAAIVQGAAVAGPQGAPVGKVSAVDAQYATVDTGAKQVKLPLSAFAKGPNGLVIGLNKADLEKAAAGAGA